MTYCSRGGGARRRRQRRECRAPPRLALPGGSAPLAAPRRPRRPAAGSQVPTPRRGGVLGVPSRAPRASPAPLAASRGLRPDEPGTRAWFCQSPRGTRRAASVLPPWLWQHPGVGFSFLFPARAFDQGACGVVATPGRWSARRVLPCSPRRALPAGTARRCLSRRGVWFAVLACWNHPARPCFPCRGWCELGSGGRPRPFFGGGWCSGAERCIGSWGPELS